MKKGLELLKCPNCQASLRYLNNGLVPGEREPVSRNQIVEKETIQRDNMSVVSNIRKAIDLSNQIIGLESQIVGYVPDISGTDINTRISDMNQILSRLMRIQIVDLPKYSSDFLTMIYSRNQSMLNLDKITSDLTKWEQQKERLRVELESIKLPLSDSSKGYNDLNSEYRRLEAQLKQIQSQEEEFFRRQMNIEQLNNSLTNLRSQEEDIRKLLVSDIGQKYEYNKKLLSDTKTKKDEGIYGQSMVKRHKNLDEKRQKVVTLCNDVSALQKLKQTAINVECKQLQDTVDNINTNVAEILPLFFTEPITMTLHLYKTLKTTGNVKPGLNISIKYKGVEYDNISQLSGGEGDRISLALVIALNQTSNSPVILLDECISSLDTSIKESCIQALKGITDKTIVCVDHEGVEGHYDRTIELTI